MAPGSRPGTLTAVGTLAAALLLLAACSGAGESDTASDERGPGQRLFEENCAECHGERALGDGPLASSLPVPPPTLMEHLGHHPRAQLVRLIRSGVPPAMPPAPLTEEEIGQVIDYAWTLVPDSLVEGLREMQRMAEMGMDMGGTPMDGMQMDGMRTGGTSAAESAMDRMDADPAARDSTGR